MSPRSGVPKNEAQREQAAVVRSALEVATPTIDQVSKAAGVSYGTLYSWKIGRRFPRPAARARLAEALASQGRALLKLAEEVARG